MGPYSRIGSNFDEDHSLNTPKRKTQQAYTQKVLTDTRELLFSNKPAEKLARAFLEKAVDKKSQKLSCHELLNRKNFQRIELGADLLKTSTTLIDDGAELCSLLQIMERQEDLPR